MNSIFVFDDYRKVLKELMVGRGVQVRLAQHVGCQQSYLSRVLAGRAELSQEQALSITTFFGFDQLESEYFLVMVNLNRAGSAELRSYYKKKLDDIVDKKLLVRNRVKVADTLTPEQKSIYYSDWLYCAVHVLSAVERYRTVTEIAKRLGVVENRIMDVLQFLETCGLVAKAKNRYMNRAPLVHLTGDSELIRLHHMNWRLRAVEALSRRNEQNLNYSSVISCSESDSVKIRELFLETIQKARKIIQESSPDEQVYCYNLDFFGI
jgi:uncharacterized protein (TIGR02147 family)